MALAFTDPAIVAALVAAAQAHCLVELDPTGRVLDASEGFMTLVGLHRSQVVGQRISQIFAQTDCDDLNGIYGRIMQGEVLTFEPRRQTHDGRTLVMNVTYVPVIGDNGRPERILTLVVDVSAIHREAEGLAHLVAALSRAQAQVELTPEGEIIAANENFLASHGYALEEVRGRNHRILVDPAEAASPAYAEFWNALRRGESQLGEFRRIAKDGRTVHIIATYTAVLDSRGKVSRVVKFATDVTRRKLAVEALVEGISRIATGDLTGRIDAPLSDEFARVQDVFNRCVDAFAGAVNDLRGRAEAMNEEAVAIAHGADDLARRGESQAASLEQTAAAVEQISGNVTMTSEAASEADGSARATQEIVQNGAAIVASAIAAMERIDGHTRSMGEFTRVIENFAFQTNLLSINAAVEAARAGEVGRGFAVVANEVRNLAQQSAKASQSIAELIGKSEAEVAAGVRLVRDAGAALDQIRTAASGMVKNIAGIAHATADQASGTREVSEALSQLDSVNQSNLILSDQNASAAAALSSQIAEMTAMLSRFRTGAEAAQPATPRSAGTPAAPAQARWGSPPVPSRRAAG